MGTDTLQFKIETEREEDGKRWIAEVIGLPGVFAYGKTQKDAIAKAQAFGLRVFADRIEHGEAHPTRLNVPFAAVIA